MASVTHAAVHTPQASPPRPSTSPFPNSPSPAYILWQRREYPKQLWYFVASGITLFILANLWSILRRRAWRNALLRNPALSHPTNFYTGPISWRRLPAAIRSVWNTAAHRWTIPYGQNRVLSLTELGVTTIYAVAVLTWSFVNSNGGKEVFWAQRTGDIAFTQIPLLPLLSGKNNILSLVTGISYEKLNIMHRAVARLSLILILLHALSKAPNFTSAQLAQEHYLSGTLGATAFGALFLFSLRPVRTHAFEFFLILHICLVAIYLACAYLHQPKLGVYIWISIGFWLFDRVGRVIRLVFINNGTAIPVKAAIEHVSRDALRITLPDRNIRWSAGQHVLLTFPGVSALPFQSHPFTIASICEPTNEGDKSHPLVFIIRAMDGFTRHLYNYAVSHPGKPVTVLVDGPYGRPPSVDSFSSVVLLAGGSGVSFSLPLLLDVISSVRRGKSPVGRVLFVWSVKHRDDVIWAAGDIMTALKTLPTNLSIDVRIHVTRANGLVPSLTDDAEDRKGFSSHPVGSGSTEDIIEKVVPASPVDGFQVCLGRPDLLALVREEVESAQGPVSVNASGPLTFTNAVRRVCRADFAGPMAVLRGAPPLTLHTENFGAVKMK